MKIERAKTREKYSSLKLEKFIFYRLCAEAVPANFDFLKSQRAGEGGKSTSIRISQAKKSERLKNITTFSWAAVSPLSRGNALKRGGGEGRKKFSAPRK